MVVSVRIEFAEFYVAADAQPFEQLARRSPFLQSADVMHAGAELVSLQCECVSPSSGEVMLLENQHPLPYIRERDRGTESARARTDDDDVPVGHAAPIR